MHLTDFPNKYTPLEPLYVQVTDPASVKILTHIAAHTKASHTTNIN